MHLDQFKTTLSSSRGNLQSNTSNISITSTHDDGILENRGQQPIRDLQRSYNLTRAAAIRMVSFSFGFALINVAASIQTILLVISRDKDESKGLRGSDLVGALMGILIYLVFGLPHNITKFCCRG